LTTILGKDLCHEYVSLQVKEDKPEISFGDVGKELGERWKAISDKEKAKFEEMAKKDKDRYTKEKTAYDAKGGAPAAADDDDDEDDE
jgi:structure-specific recognition protein 1